VLQPNQSHQDLSQVPTRGSEMASLPKDNLMRRARSCVTEFLFTIHVAANGNCVGLISKCVLKLRKNHMVNILYDNYHLPLLSSCLSSLHRPLSHVWWSSMLGRDTWWLSDKTMVLCKAVSSLLLILQVTCSFLQVDASLYRCCKTWSLK